MTDQELLTLAAKAAGILPLPKGRELDETTGGGLAICGGGEYTEWNPLADDGDALRLAVKLEISVLPCMEEASARHPSYTGWINEECGSDPYAATRRCIVRAAAAIGKGAV